MGEEFYSIVKLVSGEEIFSLVSCEDENENPSFDSPKSNYHEINPS